MKGMLLQRIISLPFFGRFFALSYWVYYMPLPSLHIESTDSGRLRMAQGSTCMECVRRHSKLCNEVMLVWGSLRLSSIKILVVCVCYGSGMFRGRDYTGDAGPSYLLYFVLHIHNDKQTLILLRKSCHWSYTSSCFVSLSLLKSLGVPAIRSS